MFFNEAGQSFILHKATLIKMIKAYVLRITIHKAKHNSEKKNLI